MAEKQIDLHPSEWRSEHPKPVKKPSVWAEMRQASREYETPKITIWTVLGFFIFSLAMTIARNGWPF